jgi:tetratricopeptide (TPR) repeat protein
VPPLLSDLLTRYLQGQKAAHERGLILEETSGEVVPFEAVPVQLIEPRVAWEQALAALRHYQLDESLPAFSIPPDWPTLITARAPEVALPFCLGNYPQMVRNLSALLEISHFPTSEPVPLPVVTSPGLGEWVQRMAVGGTLANVLVSVGVLRLAGQFDQAGDLLDQHRPKNSNSSLPAWDNEKAALAWHRGSYEEAFRLWQAPKGNVPAHFNRGMAALFLKHPAEARTYLAKATAGLGEDSPWYHLGRLYLALAEDSSARKR